MQVRLSIQCAFGCVYEGKSTPETIVKIIRDFDQMERIAMLCLSDTTGMADPRSVDYAPARSQGPCGNHSRGAPFA